MLLDSQRPDRAVWTWSDPRNRGESGFSWILPSIMIVINLIFVFAFALLVVGWAEIVG